jgi:hypothetical protein
LIRFALIRFASLFFLAVWRCDYTERDFASHDSARKKDPGTEKKDASARNEKARRAGGLP